MSDPGPENLLLIPGEKSFISNKEKTDTNLLCRFPRRIVEKMPAATISFTWRFIFGKIGEMFAVVIFATWSMIIEEIKEMNALTEAEEIEKFVTFFT